MSVSKLATVNIPSPNCSSRNGEEISVLTIHCFACQVTAKRGCEVFHPKTKQASANYVVGYDGSCGCSVDESLRSWCSSNGDNDRKAITIEVSSDSEGGNVTSEAWNKLTELIVDIMQRHGKNKLVWLGDNKEKVLSYKPAKNELVITLHKYFANKSCPGKMVENFGDLAQNVNYKLAKCETVEQPSEWAKEGCEWCIENNIISGYGGGKYGWKDNVTREQLAVMLMRALKK